MPDSKSKLKTKTKVKSKSEKNTSSQVWCVDVCEHEVGWAIRLEDTHEFPNKEKAEEYVRKANAEFASQGNSDCYAVAHSPYEKGTAEKTRSPWIINR